MTPQTPSRRTIVKGAAWSAPVVTIAAAAPSLAASPVDPAKPNLSTSTQGVGSGRTSANVLEIKPATINNTGGQETGGLTIVFASSDVAITDIKLGTLNPALLGITLAGLNSNTVTMNVPASLGNVAAGGTYTSPFSQVLTFAGPQATSLTVTVTAVNGGVPWEPPTTPVPAL